MKQVIATCLAVLLLFVLMPVTADASSDSVTITVKPDKTVVNPGDIVHFDVMLGAVEKLGGMDFELRVPEGLTIDAESISMQDGLKDILKSDGNIVPPSDKNQWMWAYSVGDESYTGTEELCILSFSCTVESAVQLGEKSVTLEMGQCFDEAFPPKNISVNLVPAAISVEKQKVSVSGITLDRSSLSLKDGETATLTATVAPADADDKTVTWSSDNAAVASVAADGTVTAVKAGTANITVTTRDGSKTASCSVTVSCNHTLTLNAAVQPTCGQDGSREYYSCSKCGKKFADGTGTQEITDLKVSATGKHGETEVRDAAAATEEREGYTGDTYCKVCGNKIATGEVIARLPHTHVMTLTPAVEPSCETDGNVAYYTCGKCGKMYADAEGKKELADVTVKAPGHTPGAWSSDDANHWKNCTVCGEELEKSAHAFVWLVDKAATEDETGLSHEECSCGAKRSENTVIPKLDHVHIGIQHHPATDATCTTKGNVEYWTCAGAKCQGKYYQDNACQIEIKVVETAIDPDHHVYDGDADSDCNLCGYKRFYLVISGANAIYMAGSENDLTFTADGDYKLFQAVEVDGKALDTINYEVKEGSTIVILKAAYLNTLSVSAHNVRILYTDGKAAECRFVVEEESDDDEDDVDGSSDKTSDTALPLLSPNTGGEILIIWSVCFAVSCVALTVGFLFYKRRRSHK